MLELFQHLDLDVCVCVIPGALLRDLDGHGREPGQVGRDCRPVPVARRPQVGHTGAEHAEPGEQGHAGRPAKTRRPGPHPRLDAGQVGASLDGLVGAEVGPVAVAGSLVALEVAVYRGCLELVPRPARTLTVQDVNLRQRSIFSKFYKGSSK